MLQTHGPRDPSASASPRHSGRSGPSGLTVALLFVVAALAPAAILCRPTSAQEGAQERVHEEVGRMADLAGDVEGTPPGGTRAALHQGDGILLGHLVETARDAWALMRFTPHGDLRLGQETRITVDQSTIDQANRTSRSVLSLLVGRIELALGSLFRGEVTVETPTADLGIKGTVLRVLVDASGRTLVAVLEGTVEVTSKAGGTVLVHAGSFSIVDPEAPPLPPAPFDPSAGTLSPSAGGPDFAVPGEGTFSETPLIEDGQTDLPREPPRRDQLDQGDPTGGNGSGGSTGGGR